jgi:hypothetical protein
MPMRAIEESCTHINIQQKNPNFQTSNLIPTQLGNWTIFMPRIATFTYIHKVRTRIILGFLEKHTNISKETFTLSTYKMQVELKRKNLIVCMVFNANFLPCCNGCIIRKITNIVEIYK